jgi:alkanesulfonate monooxygenase SsuD/methylene tetrahydromethanopterin reductase-like flavin-dependent oxidoreductase (luciferase family)
MRFGIFDSLDRSGAPLRREYEERLQMIEAAEAAGFHCYHIAEHHGSPLCVGPSPSVFLAAVAQRTTRIRLGPLCYLLPLYHPLRLIEEICMLDHLSGGRFELGVSRGVSPYELGFYGVDAEQSRAIFDEALEVVIAGLTSEHLTFAGERFRFDNVPMEVAPLQKPYPPLWYPTTEMSSMERVASHGFNFVALGPALRVRAMVDEYWRVWQAHRDDPARLNGHVAAPLVGINRHVLVADSEEEALALASEAHAYWNRSILKVWHDHQDSRDDEKFSWETATSHETFIFGSPDTVAESVSRLIEQSGVNYVLFAFAWGSLTHAQTMRSIELFAEEVMPRFIADAPRAGGAAADAVTTPR